MAESIFNRRCEAQWSVEATLTGHGDLVRCVAVLPDGRLATGSGDKTVKVWKELVAESIFNRRCEAQWSLDATLTGHSAVDSLAVLPHIESKISETKVRLVTGSRDGAVKVWGS